MNENGKWHGLERTDIRAVVCDWCLASAVVMAALMVMAIGPVRLAQRRPEYPG